jgi:hypothetical protein
MIKITGIKTASGQFEDPHLSIVSFKWVNEQDQKTGETARQSMYDWIVNKKGKAYLVDQQGNTVYLFGVVSSSGQTYIKAAKDGAWTEDLLQVTKYT